MGNYITVYMEEKLNNGLFSLAESVGKKKTLSGKAGDGQNWIKIQGYH